MGYVVMPDVVVMVNVVMVRWLVQMHRARPLGRQARRLVRMCVRMGRV